LHHSGLDSWKAKGTSKRSGREHTDTKPPNTISATKCLIKIRGSIHPTIDHKLKYWASLKKDGEPGKDKPKRNNGKVQASFLVIL
jgi:hypothetical protein